MKKIVIIVFLLQLFNDCFAQEFLAAARDNKNMWGYINPAGEWIVIPQFTEAKNFSDGLAIVNFNGKVGIINKSGEWVGKPEFKKVQDFRDGHAPASIENNKWGIINTKCEWILKPEYSFVDYFVNGYARVKKNLGWCYVDRNGVVLKTVDFFRCESFQEGMAAIEVAGKWGFIDTMGTLRIKPEFPSVDPFFEGLAQVEINGKFGFIDKNGKLRVEAKYLKAKKYYAGMTRVFLDNAWSFIDTTGKVIITLDKEMEEVSNFHDGYARARNVLSGDIGFINEKGKWVIQPKFYAARDFNSGLAIVKGKPEFGLIDLLGNWVIQPEYSKLDLCSNKLLRARNKDGKWGFLDTSGHWIVQPIFTHVELFVSVNATNKKKWAIFDSNDFR